MRCKRPFVSNAVICCCCCCCCCPSCARDAAAAAASRSVPFGPVAAGRAGAGARAFQGAPPSALPRRLPLQLGGAQPPAPIALPQRREAAAARQQTGGLGTARKHAHTRTAAGCCHTRAAHPPNLLYFSTSHCQVVQLRIFVFLVTIL